MNDAGPHRGTSLRPSTALGPGAALGLGVAALALSVVACAPKGPRAANAVSPLVGKRAPAVQGTALSGDGPTTLEAAAGKVTIVDFWATFCIPCRKSFPKYQQMVEKYAGDLVIIAVSVDDPEDVQAEELVKFGQQLKVSFPLVWDKEKKTVRAYDPPKMPTSYLIDAKGIVRYVHPGYSEDEAKRIEREVDALLREGIAQE